MTALQSQIKQFPSRYREQVHWAWRAVYEGSKGYSIGSLEQTPLEAAEEEGLTVLSEYGDTGLVVCADDGDRIVAISDVGGAWAVDITEALA